MSKINQILLRSEYHQAMKYPFYRSDCFRFAVGLLCLSLLLVAPLSFAGETGPRLDDQSVMRVFVRAGCPHCAEAKEFLAQLVLKRPGFRVVYRPVDAEEAAFHELVQLYQNAGLWPPGVPTFVIGDRIMVGFESAQRTGPELRRFIETNITTTQVLETELFGTISVSRLGLPLFTLCLGLLDGFNPCAMWVLMFLLSLLVHLHDRKRMAMIAGTFVLVSGVVYFGFMAAWLNIFLLVGISNAVLWALGSAALIIGAVNIKHFVIPAEGVSLSIPGSVKPGLYARMRAVLAANSLLSSMTGVAVLAVIVNFIELLCTAGFPAIFSAVLAQQDLSPSAHYAYLLFYIAAYMADDTLMVAIAVIALSSQKLSEHAGRWLKLASGIVMVILGAVMLLKPDWLF